MIKHSKRNRQSRLYHSFSDSGILLSFCVKDYHSNGYRYFFADNSIVFDSIDRPFGLMDIDNASEEDLLLLFNPQDVKTIMDARAL